MSNWKQRYSSNNPIIPLPKGYDNLIRHIGEHGWKPKGNSDHLKSYEDYINSVHDTLHGWNDGRGDEPIEPDAFFRSTNLDRSWDTEIHDHPHPQSGKPITGLETRYTDD